jgi:hypothetical protein
MLYVPVALQIDGTSVVEGPTVVLEPSGELGSSLVESVGTGVVTVVLGLKVLTGTVVLGLKVVVDRVVLGAKEVGSSVVLVSSVVLASSVVLVSSGVLGSSVVDRVVLGDRVETGSVVLGAKDVSSTVVGARVLDGGRVPPTHSGTSRGYKQDWLATLK